MTDPDIAPPKRIRAFPDLGVRVASAVVLIAIAAFDFEEEDRFSGLGARSPSSLL